MIRLVTALVVLVLAVTGCERGEGQARFQATSAAVLKDATTNLEWTRRDAGQALDWQAADRYCHSLDLGGGGQWRLPEIDELATLYDGAVERPCESGPPCHIDPVFEIGSPYLWSASAPAPERRQYFDFRFGTRLAPRLRPGLTRRVLCVRGYSISSSERSHDSWSQGSRYSVARQRIVPETPSSK